MSAHLASAESFTIRKCVYREAHAVEAYSRQTFARHTHDSFGIGRIVSGAHRSWSGRGPVEAGPGSLITCNPGEVHDGAPIGDARQWKIVYLPPALVADTVADIRNGAAADFEFAEPVLDDRRYRRAFESMYEASTSAAATPMHAQECLLMLLSQLLRPISASTTRAVPEMKRLKARIDADPLDKVSLEDLACESGMSRFQVLRRFTCFTGLSPHAYIVQKRVEVARRVIVRGAGLAEAAAAGGFADQSHFHREFVRRYGITPGKFAAAVR